MNSPELLLIGGKPFSGKSTISKHFVNRTDQIAVKHLSMGDRLRAIGEGKIESRFASLLINSQEQLKAHTPVPHEVPIGVFEEFIEEEPADIVILDAFPRYPDRLDGFKDSVHKIGSRVIAVCEVDVTDETSLERSLLRQQRYQDVKEDELFVRKRLSDFQHESQSVLTTLATLYPHYVLDGMLPIDVNVSALHDVCSANSSLL